MELTIEQTRHMAPKKATYTKAQSITCRLHIYSIYKQFSTNYETRRMMLAMRSFNKL